MTTSRSVTKSSSTMFGLARRPSVGSATSPTSGPKSAPAPAPGSPPPAPALSVCSPSGPAADELSTTPRRSNNDKLHRSTSNGISAATNSSSANGSGAHGSPSVSLSPRRSMSSSPSIKTDGDPSNGNSTGARKLLRSPTADPTHLSLHRSISRDFALTVAPFATMGHENCSSLRDQFLRIRERFSGASSSTNGASSSSSSNSNRVAPEQPPQTTQPKPQPSSKHQSQSLASVVPSPVVSASLVADESAMSNEPSVVSVPTELVLAELNQRTRRLSSSGDLLWAQHAHVERWYVEDNFFRGSMTCWTIERGSEIVSRIAKVVSSRAVGGRVNPDVSLQWIGRQLWAVTISLPLTRSGELTNEHASLARAIDDAVAVADDTLRAPSPSPSPSASLSPAMALSAPPAAQSLCSASDVRLNPLLEAAPGESPTAAAAAAVVVEEDTNEQEEEELADATSASSPPMGRAVASDSSVSTVAAEEEAREVEGRASRSLTTQEESDTVSALPISWSMLSFSSLQSGGEGTISVHGTESRDEDARVAPDKTGWLKKKNGLNSWQPRYFELKGNRLYYFATESEGIPRGAIIMDHAHVLRGKGEHSMTFTITASSKQQSLQIIKFSHRMTHQVHPRKACLLRVVPETEEAVTGWVTALNRASFYCNLSANTSGSGSLTHSSSSSSSPNRKKKAPFYRLRSTSSSTSSVEDTGSGGSSNATDGRAVAIDSASYHHYGSVKYLQETDPLLWEIHPHDQLKIRKKAALARTRSDYLAILSKHSATFRQIFLPRPRPITLEQTLRDILPELFLINNVLYGGGDGNNALENIFEVLDGCIKRFASAQEERVRAVSALLQACARTISGGDSYFVVHSLLGNPLMIIRPAEARGHPIEIDVSPSNPCQFCITVFSAFSFHHVEDVENCGDCGQEGTASMPEPLLRVQTYHVQEFDFGSGKSSRWLRIRADGMKEDDGAGRSSWVAKRSGSDTGFSSLLDALS